MARQHKQQHHSMTQTGGRATTVGGVPLRGVRQKSTKKNSVELVSQSSSDKRYRGKVLASVGLDDDDDDDASYDKCDDVEVAGSHLDRYKSDNKRRDNTTRGEDVASENLELLDVDEEKDDDDDDDEYESFDQSNNRCSTLKPICNKILWIVLTVAAVIFILYDDEQLEESETDEDVIQKQQQPYSYNGYKDARIPTDDLAQFGGGLSSAALPNQDDDDETTDEIINELQSSHHHDPTGIVEVDILWEQLEGYAEILEPLEEHDLPVFWHIREYNTTALSTSRYLP